MLKFGQRLHDCMHVIGGEEVKNSPLRYYFDMHSITYILRKSISALEIRD